MGNSLSKAVNFCCLKNIDHFISLLMLMVIIVLALEPCSDCCTLRSTKGLCEAIFHEHKCDGRGEAIHGES